MAYATSQDVVNRFRALEPDEVTVVETRLGDAELLIKRRIPDLDAQVTAGTIDLTAVVMVEAEMVLRLIRNPEGYTTESDSGYSYTLSSGVASGRLTVEPVEWAMLGLNSAVYSISTLPPMPWGSPYDPNTSFGCLP